MKNLKLGFLGKSMANQDFVLSFKPAGIFGFHDPSAAISKDGEILYAVEEERLNRIKHSEFIFPSKSINFCLKEAGIGFKDLSSIVIPYDPTLISKIYLSKLKEKLKDFKPSRALIYLGKYILGSNTSKESKKREIEFQLSKEFGKKDFPEIKFMSHHLSHAAGAFYPSGFDKATIITLDGRGEYESSVIWSFDEKEGLKREKNFSANNSLGHFYGAFTEFMGYRAFNGEGKVMTLTAYGDPNPEIRENLRSLVEITSEGYDVSEITSLWLENPPRAIDKIERFLEIDRPGKGRFKKVHKDLAYEVQNFLVDAVKKLVSEGIGLTASPRVCLNGGVALNCKMNKEIRGMEEVEDLFIQPVANDAGLVLGALWEYNRRRGHKVKNEGFNVFLGSKYSNEEIQEGLEELKIDYKEVKNPMKKAAEKIANGKVIAWFDGRLELGPRALGHRSILADPRSIKSKNRINKNVKHRQNWRPFSPSILEDYASNYLKNYAPSPYMIDTFDVKEDKKEEMKAVLHPADSTSRPQTVSEERNPRYYKLIDEFRKITGVPLVLNTSFNDHGKPIVNTPSEAIKDFFGTGLDYLFLKDYMVSKE